MDARRWERIQTLFHGAAELPEGARHAFLVRECGDEADLVREVLDLLEADARGGSTLEGGLARLAGQVLDRGSSRLPAIRDYGPYRITRVLGEGGMGVVYLGERADLGSVAAIKVLRDAWISPARHERFASEQRTLAQLNHPAIARLYDADTLPDGTPWFAMEYVEGAPLTEYARDHGTSLRGRLRLFRSVCEAVQHAHQHAVIHRDLKPSNILVKPDGTVKLLDFGIAKQLDNVDGSADTTRTGFRLMTPAYAAPEQFRGDRVGIYTDVYSLGVLLYELLAGRLPFDLSALSPVEAVAAVMDRQPERPSAAARAAPPRGEASWADLDVLCLTAMHKDPQRRYRTVEALIRDIDHYLKGEPLEARPDTVRYRLGKFVGRNRGPVAVAGVVTAAVLGLTVFYTVRLARARNDAVVMAERTRRIQEFMLQLFEGGDETVGPADTLRVVTIVDRGVQKARSLDAEPAVQAELYQTLGGIYQKLGSYARADTLIRMALAQRRKLLGPEHPEVASSLVALGLLQDAKADYAEGERLVREGLEMSRRTLPQGDPAIAKATASLGQVLEDRGAYDQAILVLTEAVRLQSNTDTLSADLSAGLTELANSHFYAGHYAVSDSLNRRVLAMDRALYGDRHPRIADDLLNLGSIQQEWGRYPEAERYDRRALSIIRDFYGPNHPETASALTLVARALVSQNRNVEAETMLREALAIVERAYGPVHPRVASALNELGRVARQQGRLDDAEADFRRMAEIYRQVYNDRHYLIGIALSNLGGVYQERRQYGRAEATFREVLRRYGDVLGPDHQLVGIARIRLGRALLAQRRYPEAERESLAGYEIVRKTADPSINWLGNARTDLVAEYEALHQPAKAARFRAELADSARHSP